MSAPKPRFTRSARRDLRAILQYTTTTWGDRQASVYANVLDEACARLAEYPHLGKARPEIAPGVHSLPVERHLILYRPQERGVLILPVVHSRMDLGQVSLP
jgi:toxin ParE1/3/4